ncbi:MAG TPA: VCBS repeat-containing protein [Verrucomicrobiae bacterium]|nr:VCBS repeat-containing protein [Verrucomicrobiae bacterium]
MKNLLWWICALALLLSTFSASAETPLVVPEAGSTGFTRLRTDETGVTFTNLIAELRSITNRNLLGGSGVAMGDVDGDGFCDIYFCGLDNPNILYRNLGHWKFKDVTAGSSIACANQDSTGAAFADLDGDGDLDLLVSGLGAGVRIFSNDGKGRFTETTEAAGVASTAGSMSLALADIDGDGDLDLYIVNYRPNTLKDIPDAKFRVEYVSGRPTITQFNGRSTSAPDLTNRFVLADHGDVLELGEPDQLFLNDGVGHFTEVSFTGGRFLDEEGRPLRAPLFDWGLAAIFYDFNRDGAPDLYVCNDLFSPDRVWINDGRGNFRAMAAANIRSTSTFSMGVDFGDVNRDGAPDFFVTDMLSRSHRKNHIQVGEMALARSPIGAINNRPQKSQNTLQLNRGDGTFAEIAWYAGVQASEWSWCPIFLDVDLDGWEDLIVSNGNQYDVQNADVANEIEKLKAAKKLNHQELLGLLQRFPRLSSRKLLFRNNHDLTFEEVGEKWGISGEEISQGMALGDLDNDGDLDLVSNNLLTGAGLYRNNSSAPRVAVRLKGKAPNTAGIGARIMFAGGPVEQSQEMIAGGRYLSSDQAMRVFAAGTNLEHGEIEVTWRDGSASRVQGVKANQVYEIEQAGSAAGVFASRKTESVTNAPTWFEDVSNLLNHSHSDEAFDDLERQPLLPMRLSQLGPGAAWHDLDGDGWEDLLLPSGRGGKFSIYRNNQKGGFTSLHEPFLERIAARDQTTPLAMGPLLLVGSANYEDGQTNGGWIRTLDLNRKVAGENLLGPEASVGPMALADVDGDGLLDLFVGGRAIGGKYPSPAVSILFRNEGTRFTAQQRFEKLGLVSGAVFSDLDLDRDVDLILATHWGPVRVFRNDHGAFSEVTADLGLSAWKGLWNGVATGDLDNDGRPDLIVSNWGLNTRWKASPAHPLKLYYGDLDGNGVLDMIEAAYDPEMEKEVPLRILKCVAPALPFVQEKMRTYAAYGSASVREIYGDLLNNMEVLEVTTLSSTVFLNRGNHFEAHPMPAEAQFSPAFGISVGDLDGDGNEDIFLSQNFFSTNPEMPRSDAGRGLVLRGDGQGNLIPVPGQESGIKVYGEQRGCALADYDQDGRWDLLVTQNGAATRLYRNRKGQPGLRLQVRGTSANPAGIGTMLRIPAAQGMITREIQAGSGYWSMNGALQVLHPKGEVEVRLPNGPRVRIPREMKSVFISPRGEISGR